MYDAIKQQMLNYCDCISEEDQEENIDLNIQRMIQTLSDLTCWNQKGCETLMLSEREEVFDPKIHISCGCDNGIMRAELFYFVGVDPESIQVSIQIRDGIQFKTIEIEKEDVSYDEIEKVVWMNLSEYLPNKCSCERIEKVIIRYESGYEQLPDCIMDVACDILREQISSNKCSCACTECEQGDADIQITEVNTVIVSKDDLIKQYILKTYAKALRTISLCTARRNFMGIVV